MGLPRKAVKQFKIRIDECNARILNGVSSWEEYQLEMKEKAAFEEMLGWFNEELKKEEFSDSGDDDGD